MCSFLIPHFCKFCMLVSPDIHFCCVLGTTVVVEIPIDVGAGVRTSREVSMWEQLSLAAFLQKYWADNQVGTRANVM